jgi:hypothetical protein
MGIKRRARMSRLRATSTPAELFSMAHLKMHSSRLSVQDQKLATERQLKYQAMSRIRLKYPNQIVLPARGLEGVTYAPYCNQRSDSPAFFAALLLGL